MIAAPPRPDTRRLTEADPDFVRLHAHTVKLFTDSIKRLVSDIHADDPDAQSAFIGRHVRLMQEAYQTAHHEGQRDYWQSVSRQPLLHLRRHAPAIDSYQTMHKRLQFYVTSVAKMAHEAMQAYRRPAAVRLDEQDLSQWVDGLNVRITLQADLTWSGFNDGYIDAGAEDGARPFLWLWWMLGPAKQHCDQCPALAENSPYGAPGSGENELTQTPGDGQTDCGAACRCSWTYGPGPEYAYTPWNPRSFADWNANVPANFPIATLFPDGNADLAVPPAGAAILTDDQKSALDRFRNNAAKWDRLRGQWPAIDNLFTPTNALASVDWEQLDPEQRSALWGVISAIKDWIDTTGGIAA